MGSQSCGSARDGQAGVNGIEARGRGHLGIRESREGAQHAAIQCHLQLRRPLLRTTHSALSLGTMRQPGMQGIKHEWQRLRHPGDVPIA